MELLPPIRMSFIEDAANKEATETIVPIGKVEVITSKMLRCNVIEYLCNNDHDRRNSLVSLRHMNERNGLLWQ